MFPVLEIALVQLRFNRYNSFREAVDPGSLCSANNFHKDILGRVSDVFALAVHFCSRRTHLVEFDHSGIY